MKLHHYISVLLTAICLMVASLTACSDADHLGDAVSGTIVESSDSILLGFDVMLPYIGGSRATYEEGVSDYENTVNHRGNDYRILLFSYETNTLLCDFNLNDIVLSENQTSLANPTYRSYRIYVTVGKELTSNNNLKLVMLANWGQYPQLNVGETTIDDLAGYAVQAGTVSTDDATTFMASGQLVATDGKYIPMFGVKECTDINWVNMDLSWFGELWLLRAVAKIEVSAAEGSPELESVTLTRYNTLGTCAPKEVYTQSDYVTDDSNYKSADYLTLPGGKNSAAEGTYMIQPDDEGVFTVYVPEYQIIKCQSRPKEPIEDYARLKVKFKGSTNDYYVDFKYYNSSAAIDNATVGDFFDIKRNYCYRYTVSLSKVDPDVEVEVLPYRAVELKPDFGLKLPDITLSKYAVYLYCDSVAATSSYDTILAYDENGEKIKAADIEWTLGTDDANSICTISKTADGDCLIIPKPTLRGRDIITATIKDRNGLSVTAECVVEVTYRHLGLDKTFLGLTPQGVVKSSNSSSFTAFIVAESSDDDYIQWELLDTDDKTPSTLDVSVKVLADSENVEWGGIVGPKHVEVQVTSGHQTSTAHLWIHYYAPSPDNPNTKTKYSTYCEILVEPINLTCYPSVAMVTVGQQTSFSTRVTPRFSDYIPTVKYRVSDESIATVDDNGLVTGIAKGNVDVIAYNDTDFSEIITDTVKIVVAPDSLVLIRTDYNVVADYVELLRGESVTIKAESCGVDISDKVTWSIDEQDSDSQQKFISYSNGVVTAKVDKEGTCTLKATYTVGDNTYSAKCIFVVANKRKVIINQYPFSVTSDAEIPMQAYIFPDIRPKDMRNGKVTWTSSNPSVIAFDSPNGTNYAVAKAPGLATLTANIEYIAGITVEPASTTPIEVRGSVPIEITEFHLYIYNENGEFVQEITSIDQNYSTDINVGEEKYFDIVNIPKGKTWTAKVECKPGNISLPSNSWSKYKRFQFHGDRISLSTDTSDGSVCRISAIIPPENTEIVDTANGPFDASNTRYNEVIFKFEYNGVEYSRRFCVYSPNTITQ